MRFIRSCNIPCPPELESRAHEGLIGVYDTLRQRPSYICFGCSKSTTEPMPKHIGRELKNLARPVAAKVCTWLGVPDLTMLVKLKVPTKKSPGSGFVNLAGPGTPIEYQPTKRPHLMQASPWMAPPFVPQPVQQQGSPRRNSIPGPNENPPVQEAPSTSVAETNPPVVASNAQLPVPSATVVPPTANENVRVMYEGVVSSIEANAQAAHQAIEHFKSATLSELTWLVNNLEAARHQAAQHAQQTQMQRPEGQQDGAEQPGPVATAAPQPQDSAHAPDDAAQAMVNMQQAPMA